MVLFAWPEELTVLRALWAQLLEALKQRVRALPRKSSVHNEIYGLQLQSSLRPWNQRKAYAAETLNE